MIIAFILTMPNVGSWNGKWSGEGKLYCITKSFNGKQGLAKAEELLKKKYWHYSWNDGWGASIEARKVDGREAGKLRRKSSGFCGYDWMVETIIKYGKPLASHECRECGKHCKLTDEDAGSDREIERLCIDCFSNLHLTTEGDK